MEYHPIITTFLAYLVGGLVAVVPYVFININWTIAAKRSILLGRFLLQKLAESRKYRFKISFEKRDD